MTEHRLVDPDKSGATAESNLEYLEQIRGLPAGSLEREELITKFIEDNIPLVILRVNSYLGITPSESYLIDDMIAEGFLALTEAVRKLADADTPEDGGNPSGYIGQRIIWAISRLAENESKAHFLNPKYRADSIDVIDPRDIIEVNDALYAACETEEDRIIIEMRVRGCTDQDISDRLEIPRRAVCFQRHQIEKRYRQLSEE
jgi:hypothetical protein